MEEALLNDQTIENGNPFPMLKGSPVEKSVGEGDSTGRDFSSMRTGLIVAARRTPLMNEEITEERLRSHV